MKNLFARFAKDESGVTAIEYGLIAGLIAVVIIGAVTTLGTSVSAAVQPVSCAMPAVLRRIAPARAVERSAAPIRSAMASDLRGHRFFVSLQSGEKAFAYHLPHGDEIAQRARPPLRGGRCPLRQQTTDEGAAQRRLPPLSGSKRSGLPLPTAQRWGGVR